MWALTFWIEHLVNLLNMIHHCMDTSKTLLPIKPNTLKVCKRIQEIVRNIFDFFLQHSSAQDNEKENKSSVNINIRYQKNSHLSMDNDDPYVLCIVCKFDNGVLSVVCIIENKYDFLIFCSVKFCFELTGSFHILCIRSILPHHDSVDFVPHANQKSLIVYEEEEQSLDRKKQLSSVPMLIRI